MLLFLLVISSIPPNFCQLALASTSYTNDNINFSRKSSTLAKGLNVRDTRSKALFPKYSDLRSSSFNTSAIESEIAAIFKEFAYGSSSTLSPSSTSTTTTTSTPPPSKSVEPSTLPSYLRSDVTKQGMFIGKQREVFAEVKATSDDNIPPFLNKDSSTRDYSDLENNSAFTYLVNTDNFSKVRQVDNFRDDKPRPVIDNHSSFNLDEENQNDIQLRVTSFSNQGEYDAIQNEIGRAWVFHVYLTGISFGIVAAVCLLSLSRISTCSQLLPRGYFITLHLMVFFASFLRCLLFLHDPYGAYDRLPSVLTSLLFNSVDPCLTTAYSIVLLVLLRAARIRLVPLNMQSPLVLATLCGIHIGGSVVIDVSSGVLEDLSVIETLNITTQAITVAWGSILCLGYVISFSGVEKAAHRQKGDLERMTINRKGVEDNSIKKSTKPSLIYAARLFLICTLLHGLLIAFIILNLVTTKVPKAATSSEAWAWWTQTSLERIVEISLCILLLATALVLTQPKPRNTRKDKEENIFSILSNCGGGTKGIKNIDVYPVANEKCNILGNGSMRLSSNGSMNFSKNTWRQTNGPSNDHTLKNQIVLNTIDAEYKKAVQDDCVYNPFILFSPLQLVQNGSNLRTLANVHGDNYFGNHTKEANPSFGRETRYYDPLNKCNQPLSGNNYYCSQRTISKSAKHQSQKSSTVGEHLCSNSTHCEHSQLPVYNISAAVPPTQCNNKYENEYEIAPYYTHSSSSSSYVYTKPYTSYPSSNMPTTLSEKTAISTPTKLKLYRNSEAEPKSEVSAYSSSQSEIHVDYLTDVSSNDGLGNSLSRSVTLPLHANSESLSTKDKEMGEVNGHHVAQPAGVMQSSPTNSNEFEPDDGAEKRLEPDQPYPTGLLRLNTNSLNDVFKTQSGLLGKLATGANYSPLTKEESNFSLSPDGYPTVTPCIPQRTEGSGSCNTRNAYHTREIGADEGDPVVFLVNSHPVTSI